MPDFKALLVEDKSTSLSNLKKALSKSGFQVAIFHDVFAALADIAAQGADLIVSSVDLPELNGFQLSSLLKSSGSNKAVPVVLIADENEIVDNFWSRASLADLIVTRKEADKQAEKTAKRLHELVKEAVKRGWKRQFLQDRAFITGTLSGAAALDSSSKLLSLLTMERSVEHFVRQLSEAINSRVEFMTRYFEYINRLFQPDVSGMLVCDPRSPWGILEITGTVSKSAFEKFTAGAHASVGITAVPRLIINGAVAEKGGGTIKSSEILPVKDGEGNVLGAILMAWTSKHALDASTKTVADQLAIYLLPVFRILFDRQEIQVMREREAYWSSTDPVTGLYNLEFFIGFLQQQLLFSFRQKLPVGLIICDIDRFLEINQEFGSQMGDIVLTTLATKLNNSIRSSDLIGRYGADQFSIVLPNTDIAGSQTLAEKLRADVEQMKWEKFSGKQPQVTISVGCAAFNMEDLNPETILRDAKVALMAAKEKGRNCVAV